MEHRRGVRKQLLAAYLLVQAYSGALAYGVAMDSPPGRSGLEMIAELSRTSDGTFLPPTLSFIGIAVVPGYEAGRQFYNATH